MAQGDNGFNDNRKWSQADPGWPAEPKFSIEGKRVGDFIHFTDDSRRQITKVEHTITNTRPGESGEHHCIISTTYLFEKNPARWLL